MPSSLSSWDREITPRFPDGVTLLSGYGQFLSSTGLLIKERSKVLILMYPLSLKDAHKSIQEIREKYKSTFKQESVLRVDGYAEVSFGSRHAALEELASTSHHPLRQFRRCHLKQHSLSR
ncbi:MAG: DUF3574 domain-containing protein [Bryobacteraceae bacterium]